MFTEARRVDERPTPSQSVSHRAPLHVATYTHALRLAKLFMYEFGVAQRVLPTGAEFCTKESRCPII